jgi:hypothetical protein
VTDAVENEKWAKGYILTDMDRIQKIIRSTRRCAMEMANDLASQHKGNRIFIYEEIGGCEFPS